MYTIDIITKYNAIHLEREDIYSPEVQEILSQPYIVEVVIHKQHSLVRKKETEERKTEKRVFKKLH